MKYTAVLALLLCYFATISAQPPRPNSRPRTKPAPGIAASKPATESEALERALAEADPETRADALKGFLKDFPNSEKASSAKALLVTALAAAANVRMQVGDTEGGVAMFREAMEAAPTPIPENLFSETVSKIVPSLYFHGEQKDAIELAGLLEPKIQTNLTQLLSLGDFYASTENGDGAKRIALRATEIEPTSAPAFLLLATAHRLQFELEQSAVAYSKAADLDTTSVSARQGLADMYRALGRFAEAMAIYKEILAKDETNAPARTGLVLSILGTGDKSQAENELRNASGGNSRNVILLAGAAYWYAVHSDPDRAIELAQQAINIEPRYIWSHLALARAYRAKRQPLVAEESLLRARQYGRFPTLEYELALSRADAGLFREAVEGLRENFSVSDGKVKASLGGRVEKVDGSFGDLLAPERKASIFQPDTPDDGPLAASLKSLLAFDQEMQASKINEGAAMAAADQFVGDDDSMKVHRQVYVASTLLEKNVGLSKVIELTRSAVANTDAGLNIPSPGAAIMASELYESRMSALAKNQYVHVPDVPRQTLSAILRGRIEELAGWALYEDGKAPDSVVRLKRAVSVLPEKSAWWRSSMWKLGAALQADGKDTEALESYIKSYKTDKPDAAHYIVVASLYKKVRGSSDGIEAEIGPNPISVVASSANPDPSKEPVNKGEAAAAGPPVPTVNKESVVVRPPVTLPKETIPREVPAATSQPELKPEIKTASAPIETLIPSGELPKLGEPENVLNGREKAAAVETAPVISSTPESSSTPVQAPEVPPPPVSIPAATPTPEPLPSPTIEVQATPIPAPTPESALPVPTPTVMTEATPDTTLARNVSIPPRRVASADPILTAPEKETDPGVEPKASSHAVVVTENLGPPTEIRPRLPTSRPIKSPAKKTGLTINNAARFDPVVITVPDRNGTAPGTSEQAGTNDRGSPPRAQCTISASQEKISLTAGGGNIGLLVGTGDPADLRAMKYYSSSPKDVSVHLEPKIAGLDDRSFFVVRSLSKNTGIYQVTFEAACGVKEILVSVR